MNHYALIYAHISSNIGDIALNAGLARALEKLSRVRVTPVLARPSATLIEAARPTFPGLADSPHVLTDNDLTVERLQHYCSRPEEYFEHLGLGHCDGVILNAGEHLYSPPDLGQLHVLALWRLMPVLAAQATGRRSVILPSTFGPFRRRDQLSRVIGATLSGVDAAACREAYSPRIVSEAFNLQLKPLLDPAFFLTSVDSEERETEQASVGITMRVEHAGLRTGAAASREYLSAMSESGFQNSESFRFAQSTVDSLLSTGRDLRIDLYVQGRADAALNTALSEWANLRYGDTVRLVTPQGLDDYRKQLRGNSAVVAARFHACILAMAQRVPAYGVHMPAHGHKMKGLFEQLRITDRLTSITAENAETEGRRIAAEVELTQHDQVWRVIDSLRQETEAWLAESLTTDGTSSDPRSAKRALRQLARLATKGVTSHAPSSQITNRALKQKSLRNSIAMSPQTPYLSLSGSERVRRAEPETVSEWLQSGWADREFPPVRLTTPIDWSVADSNRSWRYQLHSWEFMGHAFANASLAKDPEILSWAVDIVEDWTNTYSEPDYSDEFPWYDMAIAWRLHRLAFLLDAVARSGLSNDKFLRVRNALDIHLEAISDDRNFATHSNHGLYVAAAQMGAAKRLPAYPAIERHRRQAQDRLRAMVTRQFGSDGMHKEHSPDYHWMLLNTLDDLVTTYSDDLPDLRSVLRSASDALAWFVQPDGTLAMFGDTPQRKLSPSAALPARALEHACDASLTSPFVESSTFLESGYWFVRRRVVPTTGDGDTYLALTAAFHSRAHKQADDLSLVWWERGTEVLVDAGRYGYLERLPKGHELWEQGFYYGHPARVYVESTAAHNTVEIDGRSYQRRGVTPYGSGLVATGVDGDAYWSISKVVQFETIEHMRFVAVVPGTLLLILDHLSDRSGALHTYVQRFNFAPELDVNEHEKFLQLSAGDWQFPLNVVSTTSDRIPLTRGQETPLVGWISRNDHSLIPAWNSGFAVRSACEATIATAFVFGESADVAVFEGHDSLAVNVALGAHKYYFRVPLPADRETRIQYRSDSAPRSS